MEILLSLLATKVVAGIIGVVALLGVKQSDVIITPPVTKVVSDSIYINTTLKNSFPKELEKIVLSGTPVTIRLKLSLSDKNTTLTQEAIHQIAYELSTKTFFLWFDFAHHKTGNRNDTLKLKDFAKAKEFMNKFKIGINFKLPNNEKFTGILKATLDPITIEAMGGRQFDLMCFWDYHTPTFKFFIKQ